MSTEARQIAPPIDPTQLPDDPALLREIVLQLLESLKQAQRRGEQLEHRLQQLLRARFGPRAERIDPAQLRLFAAELLAGQEMSQGTDDQEHEVAESDSARTTGKRNGHGRRRLPKDLPRHRQVHEVPPDELACPCCGQERERIGEELSEQLEYIPASMYVIEHVRPKYACKHCEGHVVIADKPTQPIEKGLAGPGLLAQTIVSKYGDHLPLHRLERIFKRHGVEIPRSTSCTWMRQCADLLDPLYQVMVQEIRQSKVIHTDDTPIPVQDKRREKTRQGRIWVYLGDRDHPYTVFDYTPTRERDGPVQWLTGFEGYLQADAFGGYDGIYAGGKVIEVACWAHARRKFYDARLSAPAEAHAAMAWIRRLYAIEERAKDLDAQERLRLRQAESRPLLDDFNRWLGETKDQVLPKSPVGTAISYTLSNWEALCRYTDDGDLAIDNNAAERALRGVAVGRKNWLFAGSDRGGRTGAVLFSFVRSCERHRIDPFAYLRDVIARISDHPMQHLHDLLPDRWKASRQTPPAADSPSR